MLVKDFAQKMDLTVLTGESGLNKEVTGVYSGDLLSWVMSHAVKGDAWITVHTHLNIVAVALLVEIPCIVVPEGISVENATIQKAVQEGIALLASNVDAYELCCRANSLGL